MSSKTARILGLSMIMLLVMAGSSAVSPVLPGYARGFGVSITVVGLVLAANNFARMLFGFPAGMMVDRWGRKPFVALGMLVTAAGAFLAFSARGIGTLVAAQVLIGVGAAAYSTAALSMVIDLAEASDRSRSTGLYMMGYHLGTIVGPGVGGWLAYRYGGGSPSSCSGCWRWWPPSRPRSSPGKPVGRPSRPVPRRASRASSRGMP